MNIEIANRLVILRKEKNLSQEALAEQLGISRQAVSKWERAEASPDTDNLILLSRLYGVSLDELLKTEEEIPKNQGRTATSDEKSESTNKESTNKESTNKESTCYSEYEYNPENHNEEEYVHVGIKGVHVKDRTGEVHVGWNGIHVVDKNENVHVSSKGVIVNGEQVADFEYIKARVIKSFPYSLLVIIVYLSIGCLYDVWHPTWILFLTIPLWDSFISAVIHKDFNRFAYPVLVVVTFLLLGYYKNAWHPMWIIFLTIPVYYSLVSFFHSIKNSNKEKY